MNLHPESAPLTCQMMLGAALESGWAVTRTQAAQWKVKMRPAADVGVTVSDWGDRVPTGGRSTAN